MGGKLVFTFSDPRHTFLPFPRQITLFAKVPAHSDQLNNVLALYEQDVIQKDMPPSCQRLKTMAKKFLHQSDEGTQF